MLLFYLKLTQRLLFYVFEVLLWLFFFYVFEVPPEAVILFEVGMYLQKLLFYLKLTQKLFSYLKFLYINGDFLADFSPKAFVLIRKCCSRVICSNM
jgi:hypothetical protein